MEIQSGEREGRRAEGGWERGDTERSEGKSLEIERQEERGETERKSDKEIERERECVRE